MTLFRKYFQELGNVAEIHLFYTIKRRNMAKQAKNPQKDQKPILNEERKQKSIYLPGWLWNKLDERGRPNKQSYSNVIEIILEKEFN